MTKFYKNKGFALLYALLLSGAVLTVGVILMNIITKQLVFSSLERASATTYYYLANSGRECLYHYVLIEDSFYTTTYDEETSNETITFKPEVTITCSLSASSITFTPDNTELPHPSYIANNIEVTGSNGEAGGLLNLSVQFNGPCILSTDSESPSCQGENLIDRSRAVLIAEGYSGVPGPRAVKRIALYSVQI